MSSFRSRHQLRYRRTFWTNRPSQRELRRNQRRMLLPKVSHRDSILSTTFRQKTRWLSKAHRQRKQRPAKNQRKYLSSRRRSKWEINRNCQEKANFNRICNQRSINWTASIIKRLHNRYSRKHQRHPGRVRRWTTCKVRSWCLFRMMGLKKSSWGLWSPKPMMPDCYLLPIWSWSTFWGCKTPIP